MDYDSQFANKDNSHNVIPMTASKVGPVRGCGGPPNSPDALEQKGVFRMASTGGKSRRRGRKGRSLKRRRHSTRKHKRRSNRMRRHHRGGQIGIQSIQDRIGVQSTPLIADTNTTKSSSLGTMMMGGSRRRHSRSSRHHRKSRKGTHKRRSRRHRGRRGSRRVKRGGGVYAAALTPSYSTPGVAESSALTSPPPIVRTNNCLDTWKHLGDEPPYNEEWKGIN